MLSAVSSPLSNGMEGNPPEISMATQSETQVFHKFFGADSSFHSLYPCNWPHILYLYLSIKNPLKHSMHTFFRIAFLAKLYFYIYIGQRNTWGTLMTSIWPCSWILIVFTGIHTNHSRWQNIIITCDFGIPIACFQTDSWPSSS